MAAPKWLGDFLKAPYFTPCPHHAALHRSERNFFCVDCDSGSVCSICVGREHAHHTILQIRKSSYHDAVRVNDVGRLLDLAGIQVYVINGAKIVFLNGRPQARPMKGAPFHCETCQRALLDNCRFCSIACKLAALRQDDTLAMTPTGKHGGMAEGAKASRKAGLAVSEDSMDSEGPSRKHKQPLHSRLPALLPEDHDDVSSWDSLDGKGRVMLGQRGKRRRQFEEEVSSFPPLVEEGQPGTPPSAALLPWRTHKRKGVPHRSPLA